MAVFRKASVDQQAYTLPGRYYTSGEIYAHEQERIFGGSWICIGRQEQIADPGDYVLVNVCGENLIVLRDRAATPRALYNVCRHRGTRMCEAERGRFGETIQCPYHAWTYALDGRLIAARHMQEVAGFDKRDYPLHTAELVAWEGFLMLNLAPEPEPFEVAYAPLLGKWDAWNLAGLKVAHRVEYDVRANWKLIVQNYSECYHCPLIHPALDALSPSQSGRNDLSEGPFLGGYMTLRHSGGSMTITGRTARPPVGAVAGEDLDRVYYYSLFPNLLLSLHADYVMAHTLWPEAPDRTRIICEWLFEPATIALPDFDPADAVEFWDMTNRQDWHVSELTQLGAASRAYRPGPYANQEGLLAAFDREYLRVLKAP